MMRVRVAGLYGGHVTRQRVWGVVTTAITHTLAYARIILHAAMVSPGYRHASEASCMGFIARGTGEHILYYPRHYCMEWCPPCGWYDVCAPACMDARID